MPTATLRTTLNYLKPTSGRPIYRASDAGVGADHNIGIELEPHEVLISDARDLNTLPDLDHYGFCLQPHTTQIRDFYTADSRAECYNREIVALVTDLTGASTAVVFDHTLRSDEAELRQAQGIREPAGFVHNDYTDSSAQQRLRDHLTDRQPDRFAIINVWRSTHGPAWRSPIACCDAATVDKKDLVNVERHARDRIGELEFATFNPEHRWYYFSAMMPNEALLIKTYDSASDGRATRAIHTAFRNPLAPAGAPPRQSIESRLLVLFE